MKESLYAGRAGAGKCCVVSGLRGRKNNGMSGERDGQPSAVQWLAEPRYNWSLDNLAGQAVRHGRARTAWVRLRHAGRAWRKKVKSDAAGIERPEAIMAREYGYLLLPRFNRSLRQHSSTQPRSNIFHCQDGFRGPYERRRSLS